MAIYGVGVMVCIAPAVFLLDKDKPNWLAAIPIYLLAGVYNLFFWGLWASFCIIVTIVFIQKSSVRFDWIYWISAFLWNNSLIGYLNFKEQQTAQSYDELKSIQTGTAMYGMMSIVAFLIFAFNPEWIKYPYGWFFRIVGPKTSDSYLVDTLGD